VPELKDGGTLIVEEDLVRMAICGPTFESTECLPRAG